MTTKQQRTNELVKSVSLHGNVVDEQMFQVMDYEKELKIMENLTKEEYLASLRRYTLSLQKYYSKNIVPQILKQVPS